MKNGMSLNAMNDRNCTSIQPTPGSENVCVKPVVKTRSAIAKSVAAKKSTAKVKAYAAFYRAQSDSHTSDQEPIVLPSEPANASWLSLTLAVVMGIGVSITFGLLMAPNGILDQLQNRVKILHK